MDTWIVGRHPIGVLDDPEAKVRSFYPLTHSPTYPRLLDILLQGAYIRRSSIPLFNKSSGFCVARTGRDTITRRGGLLARCGGYASKSMIVDVQFC